MTIKYTKKQLQDLNTKNVNDDNLLNILKDLEIYKDKISEKVEHQQKYYKSNYRYKHKLEKPKYISKIKSSNEYDKDKSFFINKLNKVTEKKVFKIAKDIEKFLYIDNNFIIKFKIFLNILFEKIKYEKYYINLYTELYNEVIDNNTNKKQLNLILYTELNNKIKIYNNEDDKHKFINIFKFISELYLLQCLSLNKYLNFIDYLLKNSKFKVSYVESLLCSLFITGKNLKLNCNIEEYINKLKIIQKLYIKNLRINFMIQDFIDFYHRDFQDNKNKIFENTDKNTDQLLDMFLTDSISNIEIFNKLASSEIYNFTESLLNSVIEKDIVIMKKYNSFLNYSIINKKIPLYNVIEIRDNFNENIDDIKLDIPMIEIYIKNIFNFL